MSNLVIELNQNYFNVILEGKFPENIISLNCIDIGYVIKFQSGIFINNLAPFWFAVDGGGLL